MIKECQKPFLPTITKIHYIGDELRFQREYYNSIHKKEFLLDDKKLDVDYANLCEELANYLTNNFEYDKEEVSNSVIETIEGNKYIKYGKKKNGHTVNFPSKHYFLMYSLFKLYNFIDDYDIFDLFNRYEVISELEDAKNNGEVLSKNKEKLLMLIKEYKDYCIINYKEDSYKTLVNMKHFQIILNNYNDIEEFLILYNENEYNLYGHKNIELYQQMKPRSHNFLSFSKIRKKIKDEYIKLDTLERKTKSLDLHKPTNFLDDLLNDKIEFITIETLLYILEDLQLEKTDIYFFATKRLEQKSFPYKENSIEKFYNI